MPEGVDIQQVKSDLEQLDHVASINQLNLWTMDGLEKNAIVHVCLEHVNHMEVCKESIRDLLKESGFKMLPSKWMKTWRPTAPISEISKNWKWIKVMGMIITTINDELV